jgi:hypothetical protein
LDKENNPVHRLTTSVQAEIVIDGDLHVLKRILEEKWTKRHGENQEELTGTTTTYFIDDIPLKKMEYDEFIDKIVSEENFKLLTSQTYFNEQMSWEERRKLLTGLIKNYSYEDLVVEHGFGLIKDDVLKNGIKDTETKYQYKRKELKNQIETIPPRIDEVSKNINSNEESTIEDLQKKRNSINDKIKKLKSESNLKYQEESKKIKKQVNEIDEQIIEIENSGDDSAFKKVNSALTEAKFAKSRITSEIQTNSQQISNMKEKIFELTDSRSKLKEAYINLHAEKQPEDLTICPTCKQKLPADQRSSAVSNWKDDKEKRLKNILQESKDQKEAISNYRNQLENLEKENEIKKQSLKETDTNISELEGKLRKLSNTKDRSEEKKSLYDKRTDLLVKLNNLGLTGIVDEEIEVLQKQVDQINQDIAGFENSRKAKQRLLELESDLKDANNNLMKIEQKIDLINKLKIKYINTVEGDINSLFDRKIKVKLFDQQMNGGFRETCDILILNKAGSLVPYQYANTGSQVVIGIQIINILSKHFNLRLPVFVDNTESVTEKIECDNQLICLEAVKSHTELTIK